MVFFYKIRGGPCKGSLSHITLRTQDIVCYVGRDKHENEHLIKYGWPGDVWFHVDGLSSAHVYFRLNYAVASANQPEIPLDGAIPIDLLPEDAVYDMMQIVKHNSISGCKLASTKIVWTPHSNLKKNFDMEAGSVTYHNTKLCRYGRCHKDRDRVKALEKTKSHDHTDIDLFSERQANERALIERRKQHAKHAAITGAASETYDPIAADLKSVANKATRQGDEQSGLDVGMAALEGLALGGVKSAIGSGGERSRGAAQNHGVDDEDDVPLWKQQFAKYEQDYGRNETAMFLLERGYPKEDVDRVMKNIPRNSTGGNTSNNIAALQKLWHGIGGQEATNPEDVDADELKAAREEEREVLDAIFGEDVEWFAALDSDEDNPTPMDDDNKDSDNYAFSILDASVPMTTYEPPERYFEGRSPPPELRLEIYLPVKNCQYPFGHDPPVLALVGGGIPHNWLYKLTKQLHEETFQRAQEEEPGDPQLFTLISHVGEVWESLIEEEGVAAAKAEEEARKERLAALREKQLAAAAEEGCEASSLVPIGPTANGGAPHFSSEQERRAYAATIVARGATAAAAPNGKKSSKTGKTGDDADAKPKKSKKHYNTGVSDASLVEDLFS